MFARSAFWPSGPSFTLPLYRTKLLQICYIFVNFTFFLKLDIFESNKSDLKKFFKKFFRKVLTNRTICVIINTERERKTNKRKEEKIMRMTSYKVVNVTKNETVANIGVNYTKALAKLEEIKKANPTEKFAIAMTWGNL